MNEVIITKNDEIVMKLIHYFIVNQKYNPIILHGAKDEVWLEKLDGDYKIVRIVSGYIHNDEQLNYDVYKTKQIIKNIKKRTFSVDMQTLSIFVNLGDNVHLENFSEVDHMDLLDVKTTKDLKKYHFLFDIFPNIEKATTFKEKGMNLFMKITGEINEISEIESKKNADVFQIKKPVVTYALILINTILFFAMYFFGKGSQDVKTLLSFGASCGSYIKGGEYFRLITSAFLHIGVLHFLFNNYALYVIGVQIESFFGKGKYLLLYLGSAICGNLLSITFLPDNVVSAGASGAIFGLLGALLYFGYHYRVYLGSVMKSQIIPLLLLNLGIGFLFPSIDLSAHIGGFLAGILLAMALGVKYKSTKSEKINGWVVTIIYTTFLLYMAFFH